MKQAALISKIAAIVFLIYVIVAATFYFFQDELIYQSEPLEANHRFEFNYPFSEHFITMSDGVKINALLFSADSLSKGLILYFHGNADNLQRWGNYAPDFTRYGYDVLMVDFRGYGKSGGVPGEKEFYNDAVQILQWAKEEIPRQRFIIYGRSLGSAVASYLASQSTPDYLILETPFDELREVIYPIFKPLSSVFPPKVQFSNVKHLAHVQCPVLILHGSRDWVVPLSSAIRLKPLLRNPDAFVLIEGGSHNDLREYPRFHEAIAGVLAE